MFFLPLQDSTSASKYTSALFIKILSINQILKVYVQEVTHSFVVVVYASIPPPDRDSEH